MAFIESIRKYQTDGDRAVFDMIRKAMSYDYLRKGLSELPPEYYVAFRCLRLIRGRLGTIKYTLADAGIDAKRDSPEWVFAEHAAILRQWTGDELTLENYAEHEPFLAEYFTASFHELRSAYEQLTGQRDTLWQIATDHVVDQHWSDIESALEYAISRVDVSQAERQIVRYINVATRTEYVRKQFAGMHRVRRDGEARYVAARYLGPVYTVFGTSQVDTGKITARQRVTYDRMVAVIEEDAKEGRFDDYHVDLNGGYRIKNRYIAKKIGVHEASVSRLLRSIKR